MGLFDWLPPIVPPLPFHWPFHWPKVDPRWWLMGTVGAGALAAALGVLPFFGSSLAATVAADAAIGAVAVGGAIGTRLHDPVPTPDLPAPGPSSVSLPAVSGSVEYPLRPGSPSYKLELSPDGRVTVKDADGTVVGTGQLTADESAQVRVLLDRLANGDRGPTWDDTLLSTLTVNGLSYSNSPSVRALLGLLQNAAGIDAGTGREEPNAAPPEPSSPGFAHALDRIR